MDRPCGYLAMTCSTTPREANMWTVGWFVPQIFVIKKHKNALSANETAVKQVNRYFKSSRHGKAVEGSLHIPAVFVGP